ncbi:hypothetical protein [Agrobacterium fabrum]|uniref:hypothetical protein n=1 Tax=Agrobacterium fabrum TaxID=1176649 RepID=UPI001FCED2DF|nr:hypothetical protein [Agrobacterium fabrum]
MADPHFGHAGILGMQPEARGMFENVEDMDRMIVDRVNERVRPDDILYILGDFALTRDAEYLRFLFGCMSGRKILLTGNHDLDKKGRVRKEIADLAWDIPPREAMEVHDGGERIWLSHYAHRAWPAQHHGSYHFFGHSHGAVPPLGRSRDVGIDIPDMGFGPRRFQELIEGME